MGRIRSTSGPTDRFISWPRWPAYGCFAAEVSRLVLSLSFVALGAACLLLLDPHRARTGFDFLSHRRFALLGCAGRISCAACSLCLSGRARPQAGWLYAIAGWSGSAMGIGMGQNLGHVPPIFVLVAGAVILLAWPLRFLIQRRRELTLTLGMLLAAFVMNQYFEAGSEDLRHSLPSREAGRFTSPKAASTATRNMFVQILRMC